jgi:hypothetical protein
VSFFGARGPVSSLQPAEPHAKLSAHGFPHPGPSIEGDVPPPGKLVERMDRQGLPAPARAVNSGGRPSGEEVILPALLQSLPLRMQNASRRGRRLDPQHRMDL